MLKVNVDSGKDYLEYLRPYVLQILVESPPELIQDVSVAAKIRELCGLEIPHRTVNILLQRLAKEGHLRKAYGVYTIIKDLPSISNSLDRVNAVRDISSIAKNLMRFASQDANRDITEDEATDCLIAFLSQFSIPCLRSYLRGTALPQVNGHRDWQILLVSQFVSEISSDPEVFKSFMKLVQGHMLANALLCPDLQSVSKTYTNTTFYLDTPLLVQFLGLEGEQKTQAIGEVIALVQRLDGKFAYFSHTLNELIDVIQGSAGYIESPQGRSQIISEARKSGRTKSDLFLIAQNAQDLLKEAGIHEMPTPPYDKNNFPFQIAEDVFGDVLDDEVNYLNPRAKDYDVKSVRSIYILRRGTSPFFVEKCRAVLVTSNTAFSNAAYEYGKNYEQSREVSTVITDFSLANTAWLKAPQGAPSLPQKEVLAFAYAALRPTPEFWNRVLDEAEKLESVGKISARDHQLLRSSQHVQRELMKLTLGQDEALTEESITTTLRRVTLEIKKEEAVRLEQSEKARTEIENRLQKKEAQMEETRKKIYWRCDRRSSLEARALSIFIWATQGLIAFVGMYKIPENSIFGWLVLLGAIGSGVMRLAGSYWDIKPLKAGPAFKEWRRANLLQREYADLSIDA
jgi:hypothetical protein